jgi:hypothetical protein
LYRYAKVKKMMGKSANLVKVGLYKFANSADP